MATIQVLPLTTIRLIKSSQVITGVYSIIKELLENALDAGATLIILRLENYGFDKIELKDNGCGISQENASLIAKPHYTSKISQFTDLEHLSTYGFRGEALSSLCEVSDVSITTKVKSSPVGFTYTFDTNGNVISTKPAAITEGTTVNVMNLFKNMPVRKQFFSALKKRKAEFKKVEDLVMAFALIYPQVHLQLLHDKTSVFQKAPLQSISLAISSLFRDAFKNLSHHSIQEDQCSIEVWLPSAEHVLTTNCSRSTADRLFVFVNKRLVCHKSIEKLVKHYYSYNLEGSHGRYPLGVISISVASNAIDINLEPNKDKVMFTNEDDILEYLESILMQFYGQNKTDMNISCTFSSSKENFDHENKITYSDNSNHKSIKYFLENPSLEAGKSISPSHKPEFVDGISLLPENNIKEQDLDIQNSNIRKGISTLSSPVNGKENEILTSLIPPLVTQEESELPSKNLEEKEEINSLDNNDLFSDDWVFIPETPQSNLLKITQVEEPIIPIADKSIVGPVRGSTSDPNSLDDENKNSDHDKEVNLASDNLFRNSYSNESNVNLTNKGSWSRGQIFVDGQNIQSVHLCNNSTSSINSKRERSPTPENNKKLASFGSTSSSSKKSKKNPFKSPTVRSPLGASIKKPCSAFSIFAKDIRHQVLSENPDATFADVAQQIASKWNKLDSASKANYQEKAKIEHRNYLSEIKSIKPILALNGNKLVNSNPLQFGALDGMVAPSTPQLTFEGPKKAKKSLEKVASQLRFNFEELKDKMNRKTNKNRSNTWKEGPVGCLRHANGWIYVRGENLCAVNPRRLNEVVLYKVMLDSFSLPHSPLAEAMPFNSSVLGILQWKTLLDLPRKESQSGQSFLVTDSRLNSNGFSVLLYGSGVDGNITHGEITSLSTCIAFYGMIDLQEILSKISCQTNTSLASIRPMKVLQWLKAEAVRMTRVAPHILMENILEEKLNVWRRLATPEEREVAHCLHGKPIFSPLIPLANLTLEHLAPIKLELAS